MQKKPSWCCGECDSEIEVQLSNIGAIIPAPCPECGSRIIKHTNRIYTIKLTGDDSEA